MVYPGVGFLICARNLLISSKFAVELYANAPCSNFMTGLVGTYLPVAPELELELELELAPKLEPVP